MSDREDLAQIIANSFFAMQAGSWPRGNERPEISAGDMQLAQDILESSWFTTTKLNVYDQGWGVGWNAAIDTIIETAEDRKF